MAYTNARAKGEVPAFDAVKYKQAARTIVVDGKKRIERRPIQKSVRMVDPSGNVSWLPLYGGPSQMGDTDPYRVSIEHAKRRAGWIPLGQCPQNGGYEVQSRLPDHVRGGKPCTAGTKGGVVSDADPCRCVLDTIEARRAENKERMEGLEYALNSTAIKAAELQAQMLQETREQNALIAKAMTKIVGDKGSAK